MCKPWKQMLSRTDSVQVHKPRGVQFQKRVNLKEACTHNMRDGSSSKIGPCFGKKMFQDDDHSGRERGDGDDESHVVNRRSQDSCPTELFVFGTGHVQVEQRSRGSERATRQRALSLDSFSLINLIVLIIVHVSAISKTLRQISPSSW